MVRSGNLKPLGLVLALALTTPASAEPAPIQDWFVGMKRTAKELRIAAHLGKTAEISALRKQAYKVAVDIGMWTFGALPQSVAKSCGYAANNLLDAAKAAETSNVESFARGFGKYESWENYCLSDINQAR